MFALLKKNAEKNDIEVIDSFMETFTDNFDYLLSCISNNELNGDNEFWIKLEEYMPISDDFYNLFSIYNKFARNEIDKKLNSFLLEKGLCEDNEEVKLVCLNPFEKDRRLILSVTIKN